jgi:hypothetical protein
VSLTIDWDGRRALQIAEHQAAIRIEQGDEIEPPDVSSQAQLQCPP